MTAAYCPEWTPPEDPHQPKFPYLPGFSAEITSHVPPLPFGTRLYFNRRPRKSAPAEWLQSATQTQAVLAYPPLETEESSNPEKGNITVLKTLAIGTARGAQLLVCSFTPCQAQEPITVIAKVFDGLYYSFSAALVSRPRDTTWVADQDYSLEAAAYEHLRKANQTGSFAPQYYGSWTMSLSFDYEGTLRRRPVRLVLIEHLDGCVMRDLFATNRSGPQDTLDAFHYGEEYRLEVFARLLDGVVQQHHCGLNQNDLAPRNIMIVPSPKTEPLSMTPRVVLIDYNISRIYEQTIHGHMTVVTELPLNPMKMMWNDQCLEFVGWLPKEWYRLPHLRQEWLRKRFGGDRLSHYAPINKDLVLTFQTDDDDEDDGGDDEYE